MVDPFEEHPDTEPAKKKPNNILTLQEVRDTIDKQCEEILNGPDRTWGFTRDHIVEYFDELLERLESKCSKQH
jgi:hypothetical protein